jgi:hypothetical protein
MLVRVTPVHSKPVRGTCIDSIELTERSDAPLQLCSNDGWYI